MVFKRAKEFIMQLIPKREKKQIKMESPKKKHSGLVDYAKWAGVEATDDEFVKLYQGAENAVLNKQNASSNNKHRKY